MSNAAVFDSAVQCSAVLRYAVSPYVQQSISSSNSKNMLLGITCVMQQCSLVCLSYGTCTVVYRLIASSKH
jgi:hypothetical protein